MNVMESQIQSIKEELLTVIRNTESKIVNSQNDVFSTIDKKFSFFQNLIEENNERFNDLQKFNSVIKVKLIDKYSDLDEFQKNTKDELFSIDIRINNLQKELSKSIEKYDKIFVENLIIPGTIGDYCKYKTLRDYIEVKKL